MYGNWKLDYSSRTTPHLCYFSEELKAVLSRPRNETTHSKTDLINVVTSCMKWYVSLYIL